MKPVRLGRSAAAARRSTQFVALVALTISGCGLLVGNPVGDHIFPSDAGEGDGSPIDRSDGNDTDATAETDGPSGDGPSAGDAPASKDSASSDSAADAGPDSDATAPVDASSDAAEGGCPGSHGPSSLVISSDAGAYCIDTTEVTNTDYALFLASGFQLPDAGVPAGCGVEAGTMDYTPGTAWPPAPGLGQFPVISVNWCQAFAYCTWAGKRMCGEIGGGALAEISVTDPYLSQWYNACSAGGSLLYPYGDTFNMATCGGQAAMSQLANVGTPAACVGGFPGLYNMSGSVWEWTNACASNDPTAFCYVMGGAYESSQPELECTSYRNWTRTSGFENIGIRCCGDL